MALSILMRRMQEFGKAAGSIAAKLKQDKPPTTIVKAGTSFSRFIPPDRPLDYFDIFRQLDPAPGRGSMSSDNRWSGKRPNGTKGTSGSYWATVHGAQAESFFYTVLNGYDQSQGPIRLLPSMDALLVADVNRRLPFYAEDNCPPIIPFAAKYHTNIVMAKTIRDIEVADFHADSERFMAWNAKVTRLLRPELDAMMFKDVEQALADPDFRDIARQLANWCADRELRGLTANSVRRDSYHAPAYDRDAATNLVFFGADRETLCDVLVGTGVIHIRPDGNGATATLKPISDLPVLQERRLSVVQPTGPSALAVRETTALVDPGRNE